MTLESGPKKLETPRITQEMLGSEVYDDIVRDDLQEVESKKEKRGAVKKKIEIPGFGEIEYTEKRVMFPEKTVQETGGVKGYVRKMISWEELIKRQMKNRLTLIAEALTSGEFIGHTFNHKVFGWNGYGYKKELMKEKIIEKFGDPRELDGKDLENLLNNFTFHRREKRGYRGMPLTQLYEELNIFQEELKEAERLWFKFSQ